MYQNNRDRGCNCGCGQDYDNFCNAHTNINNRTVFYFNDEPDQRMTYQAKYRCKFGYEGEWD